MHEMSLAEGVLQLVEDTARRESASRVKLVVLEKVPVLSVLLKAWSPESPVLASRERRLMRSSAPKSCITSRLASMALSVFVDSRFTDSGWCSSSGLPVLPV